MRRWWVLALGLGALPAMGQEGSPLAPAPDAGTSGTSAQRSITSVSSNQAYAIRFEKSEDGKCKAVGLRETQQVWQVDACVANLDDLLFISNKGDRFWVLKGLPEKGPEPKKPVKNPGWHHQVVAREFDKTGALVRQRRLSELMTPYERTKIHTLARHFKWMEGVVGMKGKSPRVNIENEVEFEVAGGKTVTLVF
jgi:hypothetical protein